MNGAVDSTSASSDGPGEFASPASIRTPVVRARLALVLASAVAVVAWGLFLSNRAPGTSAAVDGFPLDDAWIHLVYARSLATEGGFHYNPGVAETGMTSPLWVIFAASVHLVAAPFGVPAVVLGIKLLSLLFGIGCVWALFALARALGLTTWASLLVAALCAADPALTFSRATGMEVPLFTLLVLLALALALKGELVAAAVATGLTLVARPEGALIVPSVILLLATSVPHAARTARRVAFASVGAALPSLLWVVFCLAATGRPLPNTFYAKFVEPGRSALANLALGWRDYVRGAEPYFTLEIGTLLALGGAAVLVARQRAKGVAILAAGALLFAGTLASRSVSAGHFHYWERWLIPAYPFLLLAFGAGIEFAAGWAGRVGRSRWLARAAAVALCALLVAPLPATLARRAAEYAWNCQNIEEMNVAVGRWIGQNVERDEVVAVIDAGATRYFGNRETVDLFGLNDHRIRAAKGVQAQVDYLRARGVAWLVLVPEGAARMIEALRLEPVFEAAAPNFTISGARQGRMVVYRWPRAVS